MNKFTYLLGAGASANSLPVVNRMPQRMRFFAEFLKFVEEGYRTGNIIIQKINTNNFQEIIGRVEAMIDEIEQHYSIDTFAKKLYLQNPASPELNSI